MRRPKSRIAILSILLVGLLIFLGVVYAYNNIADVFAPASGPSKDVAITVREGDTTADVAEQLVQKGAIRNAFAFRIWARIKGLDTKIEAGVYDINSSMTIDKIIEKLQKAAPDEILVQIKEGKRIEEIATSIQTNSNLPRFKAEDFLKYARNANQFPDKGKYPVLFEKIPSGASMEGLLFPETFAVTKDADARVVINASLKLMEDAIEKNGLKDKAAKNEMSVYQFLILASVVEREAAGPNDRDKIASVYWNRLYTPAGVDETGGGQMQADPTVQYARDTEQKPKDKYWKPLEAKGDEIATGSKYNTYKNIGFPPTPICTASLKSILAAAAPAKTDYLYFFADKQNVSHFSKTLDEHNSQMSQYPPSGS